MADVIQRACGVDESGPCNRPADSVMARQGHAYRYRHGNGKVIALTSGETPRVGFVKDGGFVRTCVVSARDLIPIPMVYFHGQVPR